MNRTINHYEHVATDSFKQLGWEYDMVVYNKSGGHQANTNKAMFGHGERKHYSSSTEAIVLRVPTPLKKLDAPADHYVFKTIF